MRRLEERVRRKVAVMSGKGRQEVQVLRQEREIREKKGVGRIRAQLMQLVDEVDTEKAKRLEREEKVRRLLETLREKYSQ